MGTIKKIDKKTYDHKEAEKYWQDKWQELKIYDWDSVESRDNIFSIDTPPPTVSGMLHMGHVFSYTQADFIARFQRMKGKSVFYPMGFDDNGLPTERLVEKVKKIKAAKIKRSEFINLCTDVVKEYEEEFRQFFKSIALSVDWKYEYQTISPMSRKLSQMSFLDLYDKGKIIRKYGPTFWDPVDYTAIAQTEIEDKEKVGILSEITFITEGAEKITIATTRPELLPACVAIFYNPEDSRYRHLNNNNALVPVFNHKVPIIPDESVEIEYGTGLVMCCTFGDIQDIHWWKKHSLPTRECIAKNGKMKNADFLDGFKVKEARDVILNTLKEKGLLISQKEVEQHVKCAERSGAVLEIIPTHQWYVTVLDYKEELLVKSEECNWHPTYMKERLKHWIEGLNQEWCISRQRYSGVQFPVWYSKRKGEEGKIILADIDDLPVDPESYVPKGYTKDEVEPDTDVMDTWATSALTPQLSTHWITEKFNIKDSGERHKKLFPFDLRPQAHEIIRTWAFVTITKSLFHENTIPWKNLMISGWCLAKDKTKMSKSKGNVITPKELIVEKGTDVIRYWASNSKLGMDIAYSDQIFKIGNKLINKIWNAAKFVSLHLEGLNVNQMTPRDDIVKGNINFSLDIWILSDLEQTLKRATKCFEAYEYSDARSVVEDFFWNAFCDNYLELVKGRAYNKDVDRQGYLSAALTMYHCLWTLLRVFAPFLPHVTEEINNMIFGDVSIHKRGSWPKLEQYLYNEKLHNEGKNILLILELVRKYKSLNNMPLNSELKKINYTGTSLSDTSLIDLRNACNCRDIVFINEIIDEDNIVSDCQNIKILVDK